MWPSPCTNCKYKTYGMSGSHHIGCNKIEGEKNKFIAAGLLLQGYRFTKINISEHGIKNGWATWPLDFDSIWIDNCELREEEVS